MTISQLEYLIKVAEIGHFGNAAEQLQVTQPTLSMMIKKLEEELGVVLLNRSSKPIVPTEVGREVIQQAQRVIAEARRVTEVVQDFSDELKGQYVLGVIPTVAPYLIPRLVDQLITNFDHLELYVKEAQTDVLIENLKQGEVDGAILATPIHDKDLEELPLFYEEFFVFGEFKGDKDFLLPSDIDPSKLWLLEEGHCLRSQIINLCELKAEKDVRLHYNSGSLETLLEIVRHHEGLTVIPELTAKSLPSHEQQKLGKFQQPAPFREMSLVVHRHSAKKKFIEAIQDTIEEIIPMSMRQLKINSNVLPIR